MLIGLFQPFKISGGVKFTNITKLMKEKPEFIIQHAVKGMLPKTEMAVRFWVILRSMQGISIRMRLRSQKLLIYK